MFQVHPIWLFLARFTSFVYTNNVAIKISHDSQQRPLSSLQKLSQTRFQNHTPDTQLDFYLTCRDCVDYYVRSLLILNHYPN